MQAPDLNHLLCIATETAKDAFRLVANTARGIPRVRVDLLRDVKIDVDYKLEEFIIKNLLKQSEYSVLSEESGFVKGGGTDIDYRWIIDPLDGSLNFLRGIPMCCISISLWRGIEPVLGVVYDFNRDENFYGIIGSGAWLNGKPIRVSEIADKSKAVLCIGFPVSTDFSKESLMKFVVAVQSYRKIRLLGSAAVSLAYVACGRADCYYENDIKIWDVAAGLTLVKAAGGMISVTPSDIQNVFKVKASNRYLLDDLNG